MHHLSSGGDDCCNLDGGGRKDSCGLMKQKVEKVMCIYALLRLFSQCLRSRLLQSLLWTQTVWENLWCMDEWSQRWGFVDGCVGNEK